MYLWEGDRRSKSGVRRLGMMAGEKRLDPGRSARSSIAEYWIKGLEVVGERKLLSRTPPPSLETEEMLDADDDERMDLDDADDDNDDDGEEEKPRRQDSMKAKDSSRSWNWSLFFWQNSGLRTQQGTLYCRIVLMKHSFGSAHWFLR